MSGFGELFDQELAKKNEALRLERERAEAARKAEEDAKKLLAEPMRQLYDPMIARLKAELEPKGIRVQLNQHTSYNSFQYSPTTVSFRLMPRSLPSNKLPDTYCFNVMKNGSVESFTLDSTHGSHNGLRLFHKQPDDLSQDDFDEVARTAIRKLMPYLS